MVVGDGFEPSKAKPADLLAARVVAGWPILPNYYQSRLTSAATFIRAERLAGWGCQIIKYQACRADWRQLTGWANGTTLNGDFIL